MKLTHLAWLSSLFRRLPALASKQSLSCLPSPLLSFLRLHHHPYQYAVMDVSANRFPYEAIKIAQEIVDAHFVAFDFEMSGVAGRRGDRGKPSLQDYYQEIAEAAKRYQILQVGLTIVKEDLKKGRYVARPYNFNLSPLPAIKERSLTRDWSSNSGGLCLRTAMETSTDCHSRLVPV